jgi:serine/threonine protein kinase
VSERPAWDRITDLFDRALQVDAEMRNDWLRAQCGADEALRVEVASLLAAASDAPGLLDRPAAAAMPELLAASPDGLEPGEQLGGYRLQERIGIGGMGSVWRAEHQRRPGTAIALKVLWQGTETPHLLKRFANERRSLASLRHPNIARLLDGGVTEAGRPFLAMEYVSGLPLDRWCDERGATVAERVDLMCAVCEAVHFAHRNLIVHRDLKPDNVLVTADGSPKLLDFGIAKLLAEDDSAGSATLTELRAMTPQYASPEQVRGEGVTTASDVYALGVVLYELLTGRRPYRLPPGLGAETQRVIAETEPPRPSTVVLRDPEAGDTKGGAGGRAVEIAARRGAKPEVLARLLAGDLDKIVMMAMRKDPARRYASAERLAADLRRFRLGLPVEAQDDAWHYRLGKFARRHAIAVGAAAITLLALVGGVIATSWQARVAAEQARFARSEANVLHRVVELMNDAQREHLAEQARGGARDLAAIFTQHAERLRRELEADPRDLAAFDGAIGESFAAFGQLAAAEQRLEQSLHLRRAFYPPSHPETAEALFRYARVLRLRGRAAEALPLAEEAVRVWEEAWGPDHADLALARALLGLVRSDLGQHADALAELTVAETLLARHFGVDHPSAFEARAAAARARAALDAAR